MPTSFESPDLPDKREPKADSWADIARREVSLVGAGLSGIGTAASEAFNEDNRLTTLGKVAFSAGVGIALARFKPVSELGQAALRSFGHAGGVSFGLDVLANGRQIADAMADAARPDFDWQKDKTALEKSLGGFVFDTGLMGLTGLAGGSLAGRMLRGGAAITETTNAGAPLRVATTGPSFVRQSVERPFISGEHPPETQALETFRGLVAQGYESPRLMGLTDEIAASMHKVLTVGEGANMDAARRDIRASMNAINRQAGLPEILDVRISHMPNGGSYASGMIDVNYNLARSVLLYPDRYNLAVPRAKLGALVSHENGHLEQETLELRRLQQMLGMGKDPLGSDIDALMKAHPLSIGSDHNWWNPDFVRQVMALPGELTPGQIRRADMLLDSVRTKALAYQADPKGMQPYWSLPHEGEAFALQQRVSNRMLELAGQRGNNEAFFSQQQPVRRWLSG